MSSHVVLAAVAVATPGRAAVAVAAPGRALVGLAHEVGEAVPLREPAEPVGDTDPERLP